MTTDDTVTTEQPYTPTETELMETWIIAHSEPGWGGPVDVGGRPKERIEEGKRGLARVRRDAAREALQRLQRHELAIIPTDADPDDAICVRQQALAWRIDCLIRNEYPEDVTS